MNSIPAVTESDVDPLRVKRPSLLRRGVRLCVARKVFKLLHHPKQGKILCLEALLARECSCQTPSSNSILAVLPLLSNIAKCSCRIAQDISMSVLTTVTKSEARAHATETVKPSTCAATTICGFANRTFMCEAYASNQTFLNGTFDARAQQ